PEVVLFNQMSDNSFDVPVMGGASSGLAIATKNVKADALKNVLGIDDCVPVSDTINPPAKDFTAAYRAKYNIDPGYAAAEAYDSARSGLPTRQFLRGDVSAMILASSTSDFVSYMAAGISEGSITALAALGFLLTHKATGVISFAQGAFVTLGAYIAVWASR